MFNFHIQERHTNVQILALILAFMSISFFCFGLLLGSSFIMNGVEVEGVDTTLFTPKITIIMGMCMWVPAICAGLAAWGVWFWLGRSSLQKSMTDADSHIRHLQEYILQGYLDDIGAMAIDALSPRDIHQIEVKTAKLVKLVAGSHKRQILHYLYDIELIGQNGKLSLRGFDLQNADLQRLDLSHVDFTGADLTNADLSGTILVGATITSTQLTSTQSVSGAIFS